MNPGGDAENHDDPRRSEGRKRPAERENDGGEGTARESAERDGQERADGRQAPDAKRRLESAERRRTGAADGESRPPATAEPRESKPTDGNRRSASDDAESRSVAPRKSEPSGAGRGDGATESGTAAGTDETPTESADEDRLAIPLETLAVLNWLGDTGVDGAERRLSKAPVDDLTVQTEQVKVGYATAETGLSQFSPEEHAGARIPLSEPLVGNILVVFPIGSANKAAALMLKKAVDDLSSVSVEMGLDALAELCNMMANGFVDEWATLFETPIDTGSPIRVRNAERKLVDNVLNHYELGLYITSRFTIPEYDVDGTIYVFPGKPEFVEKISRVGLDVIEQ
ncbi:MULTISPECIES: chemotaxis protein CheC [Halorussus]|uniref:chemotaxis protein CheC n=1 Tax=Halorussus TaxID=1070314 RepID=UPI00209FED9A|nr:chemotaxis protein CheC [Halorussus vallis]USZ74510.1 chemotaxis protein CheC [Halorussus vallis]